MNASPDFDAFEKVYAASKPQLLWRRLVSDLETPVSAYLKLAAERDNAILLESVEGGEQLGRYSIIGFDPDLIWRCRAGQSEINNNPGKSNNFYTQEGAPLSNLKRLIAESEIDLPEGMPPMAAGVFGYLGYDMVRQIERLGARPAGGIDAPDAVFIRPTLIAVFDNVRQEISLFTPVRSKPSVPPREAFDAAQDRLAQAADRLNAPLQQPIAGPLPENSSGIVERQSNTTPAEYANAVKRAKEYITAGDIFQVVLSQRFSTEFNAHPFALYRSLRRSNPSPFLFYLKLDEMALVGSSPEILVRVREGEITIRPIAGTRPRGATKAEDIVHEENLLADPKERAEHLMLLDLGRNDVGRSAEIGSVKVTEQFKIERYSHVMHIVSNVTGKLKNGIHPIDAVAAGFPAGTVSGAPKIRAMEIIDELEAAGRSVYGGAIGYFSADGNVDTCIALRTAVIKDGRMYVQAGAGIVADSDPVAEQKECENKAAALFAAAQAALGLK